MCVQSSLASLAVSHSWAAIGEVDSGHECFCVGCTCVYRPVPVVVRARTTVAAVGRRELLVRGGRSDAVWRLHWCRPAATRTRPSAAACPALRRRHPLGTPRHPTERWAMHALACSGCGRFADTYNCIKTAFHDTDILADIVSVTSVGETSCRRNIRTLRALVRSSVCNVRGLWSHSTIQQEVEIGTWQDRASWLPACRGRTRSKYSVIRGALKKWSFGSRRYPTARMSRYLDQHLLSFFFTLYLF